MKTNNPYNIESTLPSENELSNKITLTIIKQFEKNKYKKIKTPTIEYYETLELGLGPSLKKNAITFLDKNGHQLVLKPDHTTPIAKTVATRLKKSPLPMSLYYIDPIFRNSENPQEDIERQQAGIEYIGEKKPIAEVEVLKTCITALKSLGIKEFCFCQ